MPEQEEQIQSRQDKVPFQPEEGTESPPTSTVNTTLISWSARTGRSVPRGTTNEGMQWAKLFAAAPHHCTFLQQNTISVQSPVTPTLIEAGALHAITRCALRK